MNIRPNPSGPEGSSGKWIFHEIRVICWLFFLFFTKYSLHVIISIIIFFIFYVIIRLKESLVWLMK